MSTVSKRQYVVYRHGSNSANQPMCNRMPIGIVEASDRHRALAKAKKELVVTIYNNQYLTVVPISRLSAADRYDAYVADNYRQSLEQDMENWA